MGDRTLACGGGGRGARDDHTTFCRGALGAGIGGAVLVGTLGDFDSLGGGFPTFPTTFLTFLTGEVGGGGAAFLTTGEIDCCLGVSCLRSGDTASVGWVGPCFLVPGDETFAPFEAPWTGVLIGLGPVLAGDSDTGLFAASGFFLLPPLPVKNLKKKLFLGPSESFSSGETGPEILTGGGFSSVTKPCIFRRISADVRAQTRT